MRFDRRDRAGVSVSDHDDVEAVVPAFGGSRVCPCIGHRFVRFGVGVQPKSPPASLLRNRCLLPKFIILHSADEDALDDGSGERNEDHEDSVLGAVVAVTIDELQGEIETLHGLRARARRLLDSGRESKIEALTDDGERRVLDRLESGLTGARVREIERADERAYGQGEGRTGEVAAQLGGLRARPRSRAIPAAPAGLSPRVRCSMRRSKPDVHAAPHARAEPADLRGIAC